MAKLTEEQIRDVAESALDAFWASVAQQFPEAKSGDLSPERQIALRQAAERAIAEWGENNA